MLQFFDTLTDDSGNSLLGATITVTNYPSGTLASIYSANGTAFPIPTAVVSADITGQVSFYAPDGAYTLTYAYKSTIYKTRSPVQLLDPMGFIAQTDTGIANAIVISGAQLPAQKYIGLKLEVKVAVANTGPTTLNFQSDGGSPVTLPGGAALVAGMLQANGLARFEWDGTEWQLLNSAAQSQPFYVPVAAEGATVVNANYYYGVVDRYGTNTTPGTTDMTTAIRNALAANPTATFLAATYLYASASTLQLFGKRMQGQGVHATRLIMPNVTGGPAYQVGGTDTAAPGVSGMIISGGDPIAGGSNSTAYSGAQYAETGVGCRRSLNSDVLVTQFTRSDAITFTGALLANATSGTLNANWTLPTSSYEVMFSDGETRIVYLTNGATTATWPLGLTNGVTANALVLTAAGIDLSGALSAGVYYNGFTNVTCGGTTLQSITFTGSLLATATSATLNANWTLPTGVYAVQFSDDEVRLVTLTKGATTATWAIGLVNPATASAVVTGGNAAGWRSHTSDGPANGNRINANSWVNSGGVFNMGAHFMFDYAAADTIHAPDREVSSGPGIHVGTNVFGLTILGGDDENNQGGSVLIESTSSDVHLFGGNVVPAPGTSGWTVSSQFLPGGTQATNFGIAPNSAATNLVIGGGTLNLTATNPAMRLTGSTTLLFNNAAKSMVVEGPSSVNGASPPSQVTGWGSPTGASVQNNYSGSAATLAQTSAAVAEIIAYLKSKGDFGA